MKILHFADAHIDMAAQGRHDPATGLPVRVMDFLKALDTIVDAAIDEQVDLVLFAGDAYKDRTPVPTFQREWGRRMMRLSQAGIPTLLLVGNHDLSPAANRAHALQEYETLSIPHVRAISRPGLLGPADLEGLPLQVLALPWVNRSALMNTLNEQNAPTTEIYAELEARLESLARLWLDENIDRSLPVVLLAHASVQGAKYGGERSVMLGNDVVLSGGLARDSRLAYTALGHIHKAQDLNEGHQPPVVYPGSIERVDFGEAADEKFYVIAHIQPGQPTQVEWRELEGRRFIDRYVNVQDREELMADIEARLPTPAQCEGAIFRLTVEYPAGWEAALDEAALRRRLENCLEFHLIRRPQREARARLPEGHAAASMSPQDLLNIYWETVKTPSEEVEALQALAGVVITAARQAETA